MSIASLAPRADAYPVAAQAASRNPAIDRARTFLTIVVLIHHAVIPYTYFGHTDPKEFIGFDAIVLANDSYFMAMFFFLSGLFVWPSLRHRSEKGAFTRDRFLRLGVPFIVCALTVIPIAYYALLPRSSTETFPAFWWRTVTVGPWPSGPVWFTWVLLVFGIVAGAVFWRAPQIVDPINRLSQRGYAKPFDFFLIFVAVTILAYVPARMVLGPNNWFAWGPVAVQESRVLLYATYFAFGIGVGAANMSQGLLSNEGALARRNWRWGLLGFGLYTLVAYAALWGLIAVKREMLGNPPNLPHWYEFLYGIAFAIFSAAMLFTLLGYFLRYKAHGASALDWMQRDAYGIFLVHYPYVLWIQHGLFNADLPAIAKATIALVGGLALSWVTSAALRQIPGAQKIL